MTDINQTWIPCLKAGEENEEYFLRMMIVIDKDIYKKKGYFKEYDFVLPNLNITIELKRDFKSDNTGNFAFEYECFKKKSGLAYTTADYFVVVDKDNFYFFEVNDLKTFLRDNWNYIRKVEGGDSNASKMALVRKNDIVGRKFCCIINKNNPDLSLLSFYLKQYGK